MIEIISGSEGSRLTGKLERIRQRNVALDPELMELVRSIIEDVRERGDAALIDYAARFDGCEMQASDLRVSEAELRRLAATTDRSVREALAEAIQNVKS